MQVNSLHSQAVDQLGEGLRVAARDGGGMVQAVERLRDPFALGVQWHPEHLFYARRQRAIFSALVRAADAYAHREVQLNAAQDESALAPRPWPRQNSKMITRTHRKGDAPSTATYSDCERYRYALERVWDETGEKVLFVMLNPSTATEVQNDPTVERCERRARALGFGAFCVTNIFAWRDTDPKKMRAAADPIGPLNDATIANFSHWADQIICAWGTHGEHLARGQAVEALLRSTKKPLYHLGLSKAGHPKHPLYIGYEKQPELWVHAL